MKIVHVIINCAYIEGAGYQENLLPKFHKLMGLDVTIIAAYNDWKHTFQNERKEYSNSDGIKTVLLKKNRSLGRLNLFIPKTKGLYHELMSIHPDIIFVHGGAVPDNLAVVRYKNQHPEIKVFADQHGDYYNAPLSAGLKGVIQKIVRRYPTRRLYGVCNVYWGVTPWRVQYLNDVYGLPKDKVKLLVMGGDDTKIDFTHQQEIRHRIREEYRVREKEFLIITGGKIDRTKNIHLLIKATLGISDLKLMIFGKPADDFKDEFNTLVRSCPHVVDLGWIDSSAVYDYFLSADLAIFPGTHSVLWEQAAACGLPMVVKRWMGMQHIDMGGNCFFLDSCDEQEIRETINKIINTPFLYDKMKDVALNKGVKTFAYSYIARRSIEME